VDEILIRFCHSVELYNQSAQRGYDICFAQGVVNSDHSATPGMEQLLAQADRLMYQQKRKLETAR
jgi:hypothetical protein